MRDISLSRQEIEDLWYSKEEQAKIESITGLKDLLWAFIGRSKFFRSDGETYFRSGYSPKVFTGELRNGTAYSERANFIAFREDSASFVIPERYSSVVGFTIGVINKGTWGATCRKDFYYRENNLYILDPYFRIHGIKEFNIKGSVAHVDLYTNSPCSITRVEVDLNNQREQTRGLEKIEAIKERIKSDLQAENIRKLREYML